MSGGECDKLSKVWIVLLSFLHDVPIFLNVCFLYKKYAGFRLSNWSWLLQIRYIPHPVPFPTIYNISFWSYCPRSVHYHKIKSNQYPHGSLLRSFRHSYDSWRSFNWNSVAIWYVVIMSFRLRASSSVNTGSPQSSTESMSFKLGKYIISTWHVVFILRNDQILLAAPHLPSQIYRTPLDFPRIRRMMYYLPLSRLH